MADKATHLILAALGRAAAAGAAVPLHGTKAAPGLFPATTAGRQAAQRALDEGYLHPVPTEPLEPAGGAHTALRRARTAAELCVLTSKGLTHLLDQVSPRQVLEDFVRALEARQGQVDELLADARAMHGSLDALRASAEQVLRHVRQADAPPGDLPPGNLNALFRAFCGQAAPPANGSTPPDGQAVVLAHLGRWLDAGASEDCPLPDLFAQARAAHPALTLGQFHDVLRRLHDTGQIYLHPWTGPLYEIPEPPCALLVGHEIAYYASLRR